MNKYPFYYYILLLLALILSIAFWWLMFFTSGERNIMVQLGKEDSIYILKPVDPSKIIDDEVNNRKIVSNIVNIAVKDTLSKTPEFIAAFNKTYDSSHYKIRYADSILNFIQVEIPEDQRVTFKKEVKQKMSPFQLLVWDESLFSSNKANLLAAPDWYVKSSNLEVPITTVNASNTIIAVIDNGFDLQHPALLNKAYKPYNVIDHSENVQPNPENHGTFVASIAAGNNLPSDNFQGVSQNGKLMPIKIEDENGLMTTTYIIKGILYAVKNHADVVNLSLGLEILVNTPIETQKEYINNGAKDEEEFWNDVFSYAEKNKTICVLAAGNSTMLTGVDPFQRSEKTVKVGAIDEGFQKTDFSNYGNFTTLYAPGKDIRGAKPGNQFAIGDGTSFAAPIVSGFLALLKAENKNKSNTEILDLLMKNTEERNSLTILKYKTLN